MNIDRRLLGWGAFFILVGAIPLAVNAGVVNEELVRRWPSLWPLLLIGWGLGLVLRRTPIDWLGGALAAITFGVMGGGALATGFVGGCTSDDPGKVFAEQRGTMSGSGQLNVEFNCGTLAVGTTPGGDWSVGGSDSGGRGPRVVTSGSTVSIESPGGVSFLQDAGEARWTVIVPTTAVIGLGITLDAGTGTANLSGASLSAINLTVNAGSFHLGAATAAQVGDVNATVNAGSATIELPLGDRTANLSLNAGSLDVCVPAGTSIRVRWSGALGSNDLAEAGLTEAGDDTWTTAGFDESQPHLELHVSANAGSFGLSFAGSCPA